MDDSTFKNFDSIYTSEATEKSRSIAASSKPGKVAAYYGRTKLQDKDTYFF